MANSTLEERIKKQQEKMKKEQLKLEKLQVARDKKLLKVLKKYKFDSDEKLDNFLNAVRIRNKEIKEVFDLCKSNGYNVDSVKKLYDFIAKLLEK